MQGIEVKCNVFDGKSRKDDPDRYCQRDASKCNMQDIYRALP
jgi:hypothetical protein